MMAKRHSIAASLAETQEPSPPPLVQATPQPARKLRDTRKSPPAEKPALEPTQGQPTQAEAARAEPPTVLVASSVAEAKRVGLYLHEDDFKALGLAKLDDGADANSRIRAMIAIWRKNPRFRTQVDRLARTAPKSH